MLMPIFALKDESAPLAAPAAVDPAAPAEAVEEPPAAAPPAEAELPVVPLEEVVLAALVAFAAAWNASNDLAAVGLTAKTIPEAQ